MLVAVSGSTLSAGVQDDAKELARGALNGRAVTVRLYLDWKIDPKAYTTLSVPLEGLDVTFDAIRLAYAQGKAADAGGPSELSDETEAALDQELKDGIVLVVAADQEDAEITAVLVDFVYAEPYRAGNRFAIWPGVVPWVHKELCLFRDALREPIPNAEVEIFIGDSSEHQNATKKVWVANARSDENGQLVSPKATSSLLHFLFVLIHPDAGPVPARSLYWTSHPGAGHPLDVPTLPQDKWCVFLDALGSPIPGAKVDVFDGWAWETRYPSPMDPIMLDEAGRLRPPYWRPLLDNCCFRVYDPNYGIGLFEPYDKMYHWSEGLLTTTIVPLVNRETPAAERSIWGTVVDGNDQPIPGTVVGCGGVNIGSGGVLWTFFPGSYLSEKLAKVLTDSEGRFAMHLPLAKQDGAIGRPVPPGARYLVTVEAPKELGLAPYRGSLLAGQEHTITLRPPSPEPKAFTGALIFQDESGPVTDPERLKLVTLTISSLTEKATLHIYHGTWAEQKELPLGTYSATARWSGKLYIFEPVEVTPESPETIVFKPKQIRSATTIYRGRVIHGVTGAPIAQAVVMPAPFVSSSYDGIKLAAEYMEQLRYFGPETDPNGELLRVLQQDAGIPIVRTGLDGRYEITLPVADVTGPPDCIVAIHRDFLGAQQDLRIRLSGVDASGLPRYEDFKPDRFGKVPLPDLKLFPAGTVLIEPNEPGRTPEDADVRFYYSTAPGDPTPWLKDLWATPMNNRGASVLRTSDLRPNLLQSVYVPANVTLTLTMQVRDERWAPVIIEGVWLEQGQVLDLARVDFPKAVQVVVTVIDSAGKPLEGIAVRHLDELGNNHGSQVVTETNGVALIYVPAHSQGQFVVECRPAGAQDSLREGIVYAVGGYEDLGREFILRLSDDFLRQLLESNGGTPASPPPGAPPAPDPPPAPRRR
jgi:hypothetical protein